MSKSQVAPETSPLDTGAGFSDSRRLAEAGTYQTPPTKNRQGSVEPPPVETCQRGADKCIIDTWGVRPLSRLKALSHLLTDL